MGTRLEMMSWMIGSLIGITIFPFSLKMKAGDPPHVTFAIKVNRHIVVHNVLDIHSSVRSALSLPMPIHHSTSLKDGMDSFSNPSDSWILVLYFTLVIMVSLAPQTNTPMFHMMSSALSIQLGSHITSSNPVAALLSHPSTFNFFRWTSFLPP